MESIAVACCVVRQVPGVVPGWPQILRLALAVQARVSSRYPTAPVELFPWQAFIIVVLVVFHKLVDSVGYPPSVRFLFTRYPHESVRRNRSWKKAGAPVMRPSNSSP